MVVTLFLSAYVAICIQGGGETLEVMNGVIEKCEILGGRKTDNISHATIKLESGNYIISSVSGCAVGADVNIYRNRGALYFNSIYVAEKV